MKLSLSSLSRYNVIESESGYDFQCYRGAKYSVKFTDASKFFLGASFASNAIQCDLIRTSQATTGGLLLPDPKIGATLSYIILRSFEKSPASVIVYSCSDVGGIKKQKRRATRFKEWFTKNKDFSERKIESYYYESETPGAAHYSGCLFVEGYYEAGEVVGDIKMNLMSRGKMPNY